MIRIVHVSDLHFHAGGSKNEKACNLLAAIRSRFFTPTTADSNTYLLVTGDLVDDAQADQMSAAAVALAPFRGKLLCAMGNHDCCVLGHFYEPEAVPLFQKTFGPLTVSSADATDKIPDRDVLTDGDSTRVVGIGLNSVCLSLSPMDFACGQIGEDQLRSLRAILADPTFLHTPAFVYLHHRPLPFAHFDWLKRPFLGLKDSQQLVSLMDGRVDAVAFGHSGDNDAMPHSAAPMGMTAHGRTFYLDANSCVDRQAYMEMVFCREDSPDISMRYA
jgi:3',5'-cyclic AMP phosphodiesterase CpdA